ncbi:MAG: hypothetical protein IPK16_33265 [Anaerolineales bacterium]|nr:hypothetical protein [Anaerolineales bacterium]
MMWHDMLQVFNQLDAATTPTETAVAILRKQDIRIPVKAISCGVDPTEFHPQRNIDRSLMRRREGLDPERPVLLYVGRRSIAKGLDDLVAGCLPVNAATTRWRLPAKGCTGYVDRKGHRSPALATRSSFRALCRAAICRLLLNSIDAFMMPSAAELQSIATLEAMSWAADLGGQRPCAARTGAA